MKRAACLFAVLLAGAGCNDILGMHDGTLDTGTGGHGAASTSTGTGTGATTTGTTSAPACESPADCGEAPSCEAWSCVEGQCVAESTLKGIECAGPQPCPCPYWSKRIGDPQEQFLRGLAVDETGNLYLTGFFGNASVMAASTIDFGGGELTSLGYWDVFGAELGPDGNHVWSDRFGDAFTSQAGIGVATSGEAGFVLAGHFGGEVTFGPDPVASKGLNDVFVARRTSKGAHAWSKVAGDPESQLMRAVAIDSLGNTYVTGMFQGEMDFSDVALNQKLVSSGGYDIFVAKLSADGGYLWSKRFGGAGGIGDGDQYALSLAVRGNAVVVHGVFEKNVIFGQEAWASSGGDDLFVVSLSAETGMPLWSKGYGDPANQCGEATGCQDGVAIDSSGNIVVAGHFAGTVDFGCLSGALKASDVADKDVDLYVAKLDQDGNCVWSIQGIDGDSGEQRVHRAALDASGNVLLTGMFDGSLDFGGGPIVSGGADLFVAKLDPDSKPLWSAAYGSAAGEQAGYGIDADAEGNVYVGGAFDGSIDFGLGAYEGQGLGDLFLVKFHP